MDTIRLPTALTKLGDALDDLKEAVMEHGPSCVCRSCLALQRAAASYDMLELLLCSVHASLRTFAEQATPGTTPAFHAALALRQMRDLLEAWRVIVAESEEE